MKLLPLTFQTQKRGFQPEMVAFSARMWHDVAITKGVYRMSRKRMLATTAIYIVCAVIWTLNFFINWRQDGMLESSTVLFGVAAVCFAISAVLNVIRICRMKKED